MQVLIGVAASLAGVVVGAFLTRWLDANRDQRRQVRETVAAAMTLRAELFDSRMGFQAMVGMDRFSDSYLFAGLKEWDIHRALFLTAGMGHRDWERLSRLFRRVLEITESIKPFGGSEMVGNWKTHLERLAEECEEGERLLTPYCIEIGRLPVWRPMSVFP